MGYQRFNFNLSILLFSSPAFFLAGGETFKITRMRDYFIWGDVSERGNISAVSCGGVLGWGSLRLLLLGDGGDLSRVGFLVGGLLLEEVRILSSDFDLVEVVACGDVVVLIHLEAFFGDVWFEFELSEDFLDDIFIDLGGNMGSGWLY